MGLKSNAGQVGRVLSAAANVYLLTAGLALGLDLRDAVVFAPSGLRPAERKAVLRDVCHMNETEFSRHFLQGLFTGEVFVSPKTLSTSVGVRKFVFNVPGAIGYLRASDVDGTVKVIKVNGHRPDEAEYPLRIELRAAK